jgi:RNA ligase
MTQINDVLDPVLLERMLSQGYVRAQTHPDFPELMILNYTEKTQFERKWNAITRVCRGLIYNTETREVLARPFPKIHNWDEQDAPKIDLDAPLFHVGNKEDGSLGIVYVRPDNRLAIATRGSFASEQALHATELLDEADDHSVWNDLLDAGRTPLLEIVYPANRIVLDYGDTDTLFFLGSVIIRTGEYVPPVLS